MTFKRNSSYDELTTMVISIENYVFQQIKNKAAELGISRQEYIAKVLRNHNKILFKDIKS